MNQIMHAMETLGTDSIAPTASTPLSMRSAAWKNASEYDEGEPLHTRAVAFEKHVNWDRLCELAASFRNGNSCKISENFSIGRLNMVRQLIFSDGTAWVARLRLPDPESVSGHREVLWPLKSMENEIATMKLLKKAKAVFNQDSETPRNRELLISTLVPEIYHYDLDTENDVGAPYILMSYIHGNLASEQCIMLDCPPSKYGNSDQDLNFRMQMARIQVELASLKFDKIGAVYQEGDNFVIGPEIQTGLGPWNNALDYYRDVRQHLESVANQDASPEVKESEAFKAIPSLFECLMVIDYYRNPRETKFRLANRDFGAHSLLVDAEFNIVGVIDFDAVIAAPLPTVAQFPFMTGFDFDRPVPGVVETEPAVLESLAISEPLLKQYRNLVALEETVLHGEQDQQAKTILADNLLSDLSFIAEGMLFFAVRPDAANKDWKVAFETFLKSHLK